MWSLEPVLAKLSYSSADFVQTTAVRTVLILMIGSVYGVVTARDHLTIRLSQFKILVIIGLIGGLFADLLFYYSLIRVPVINAALISHLQPVFIVLMAFFILKEDRLNGFDYLGIIVMMLAALLVTTRTPVNLLNLRLGSREDGLLLGATIGWSVAAVLVRKYMRAMNSGVLIFYRFLIPGVCLWGYLAVIGKLPVPNRFQLWLGLVIGVGCVFYYEGIKRIKAAQVSALELSTPFFASVLGYSVLNESVTPLQIFGMTLLLPGIYCLSRREK